MRRILYALAALIAIPALWIGGNLLYGTLTDYTPPATEVAVVTNAQEAGPDSMVTVMIWNIGYAGLGQESDFFYDGGTSMRTTEQNTRKNLDGIIGFLQANDSIDLILLQEVDTQAHRSYHFNELAEIRGALKGTHSATFATNYKVGFVPVPYTEPMRDVTAGLVSLSKFGISESVRHQYPSSFSWPTSIYFLDRCALVQRIPMADGKQLVVINTHNSAYDDTGELKKAELDHLRDLLAAEEQAGNAVIVGGDWNQTPPGIHPEIFNGGTGEPGSNTNLPEALLPGWHWAYGTIHPTNRSLKAPYMAGTTPTFLIDLFLLSPKVELMELNTIDMGFAFSDHQPVVIKVKLK